ncbi:acyl carrier protein [Pararhodobacter zhoushanensis]|uniref:acyl carrier protein n=1 Tax=Pararhodobacter zhoushanensis TaxID=2479545 RepID=UPI000F8F47E2|nr:acyl carrier protein [Pararhodobacter zhoushanensis]
MPAANRDYLAAWLAAETDLSVTELTDTSELLASGVLDSLKIMDLTMAVESDLGITIPLEDVIGENFATVGSIVQMLDRLQAG